VKKTEANRPARQSRKSGLAGHASIRGVTGSHRVALCTRQARRMGDPGGELIAQEEVDDSRSKEAADGRET
jgi:hypothetical protein